MPDTFKTATYNVNPAFEYSCSCCVYHVIRREQERVGLRITFQYKVFLIQPRLCRSFTFRLYPRPSPNLSTVLMGHDGHRALKMVTMEMSVNPTFLLDFFAHYGPTLDRLSAIQNVTWQTDRRAIEIGHLGSSIGGLKNIYCERQYNT